MFLFFPSQGIKKTIIFVSNEKGINLGFILYLIEQVKVSSLIGKNVGLYFSASWCPPCRLFTPKLAQVYKELASKNDFEVVYISSDRDELSFKAYFSKMPWLSIPFADSETQKNLKLLFQLTGIPRLVVLDANGKVSTDEGVNLVKKFGAHAYPFTSDRKKQLLAEKEKEAKNNQTITSLLVSTSRYYVLSNDGNQVFMYKNFFGFLGLIHILVATNLGFFVQFRAYL